MAITSRRIAGQSEAITGRRSSEDAVRFRHQAADYEEQSRELRQQYRELQAERGEREGEQPEYPAEPRRPGAERQTAGEIPARGYRGSDLGESRRRSTGLDRRHPILTGSCAAAPVARITGICAAGRPAEAIRSSIGRPQSRTGRGSRQCRGHRSAGAADGTVAQSQRGIEREHHDDEARGLITRTHDPGGTSR